MDVLAAAVAAVGAGRRCALVTVLHAAGSTPRSGGARMLVFPDGGTVGTIGGGALEHHVTGVARRVAVAGGAERLDLHLVRDLGMCCGGRVEVLVEGLAPRERIVVYGAGHVAAALCPLLAGLDFDATVVDDRDELLTPERFPGVARVLGDPRRHARALPDDPELRVLIVTHDHALDQDLGEVFLGRGSAWVGMIGSRGKRARFEHRWAAAGLDPATFARVVSPVGVDLGAETPAEIAISIAAELVAVRRGADLSRLRIRPRPA